MDEVVLVPKNRSIEPRACYHTNSETRNRNKAEASIGWCGTCIQNAKKNSKSDSFVLYLLFFPAPGYCGLGAGGEKIIFKLKLTSANHYN